MSLIDDFKRYATSQRTHKADDPRFRTIREAPFPPDHFTREEAKAAVSNNKYHDKLQAVRAEAAAKPANPKQAYGDKKVPLQNIPPVALVYLGMALKEGARKYGAYNWRENDVELMTYVGAAMRHIAAWVDREDHDPESGNHHLAHAMASLAIIVDAMECGAAIDNRPPEGSAARVMGEAAEYATT